MMTKRTTTDLIVVHSSATPPDRDIGVEEINRWHLDRGFDMIGYHVVIRRDGTIEYGRPFDTRGAHAKGFNSRSIGVCVVGGVDSHMEAELNFTEEQFSALERVLTALQGLFPDAAVIGHKDLPATRTKCPGFDVVSWWNNIRMTRKGLV